MANRLEKIFKVLINFGDSEKQIPRIEQSLQSLWDRLNSILATIREIGAESGMKQAAQGVKVYDDTLKAAEKDQKRLRHEQEKEKAQQEAAAAVVARLKKEYSNLVFTKREAGTIARNYTTLLNSQKGSVEELQAQVNILTVVWKKMSAEQRNSAQGKQVTAELRAMRNALRSLTMAAGDTSRNVGNYISGMYNAVSAKIAGAMGLIYTFKRVLGSIYGPFQDLEYNMSMVRAVSGATDEEFVSLEQNARQLGATTEYTATQVAGLQLAYSRLGFVPQQIIEMTGATLDLATATGEDLAKSADVVGTTLKGFNLQASQAQRVVDVMTKSFNSSSLQLDYFYEAMKYVAPVANASNVSLEQTTAMLGILADRGIRGSQAGTALRRIFSEIAKEGGSVNERLETLSKRGLTVAGAMDEVGRYAMTALKVLVDSTGEVKNLSDALDNAAGSAKETSDIVRDNLWGDLKVFFSAVEEKMIALGASLEPMTRRIVQLGTTAVTNIKDIITALSIYLGVTKGLTIAKAAYVAVVKLAYGSTTAFGRAILTETAAMTSATGVTRTLTAAKLLFSNVVKAARRNVIGLWRAITAHPIGAIITALAAVVAGLFLFRKELDPAARAQKKLNDEMERFNQLQEEKRSRIESLLQTIRDESETEYAKVLAYEELKKLSPELTALYNKEQLAILGVAEANKRLNEQRDRESEENLRSKIKEHQDQIQSLQEQQDATEPQKGIAYTIKISNEKKIIKELERQLAEVVRIKMRAAQQAKPVEVQLVEAKADRDQMRQEFEEFRKVYQEERDKLDAQIRQAGPIPLAPQDTAAPDAGMRNSLSTFLAEAEDYRIRKGAYEASEKRVQDLEKLVAKKNPAGGEGKEKGEWSLSKDREHNRALLKLKEQLHAGKIASEEEYQRRVLQLEIDTLTKRIALNRDEAKVVMKLRQELADKLLAQDKQAEKEAEAFAANRRADEDAMLKYANDRRKAEINDMKEGLHKKLLLGQQSTAEAEQTARRELRIKLQALDKEQKAYVVGSDEYKRIEQVKIQYAQQTADRITSIIRSGAADQTKILEGATEEQLKELMKVPAFAATAWQALQDLTARTAKQAEDKQAKALQEARNKYEVQSQLIDSGPGTNGEKRAAHLENELNLRRETLQIYQQTLEVLRSLGLEGSASWQQITGALQQTNKEVKNLAFGANADGSGGGFKKFLMETFGLTPEEVEQLEQQAWDLASEIGQMVVDVQKQASQRRLNNEKKAIDAEYKIHSKLLDDKRDKGLISEKTYQRELEKLEAQKAAREEEAERAAFERDKKLNIQQVIMNTSLGIMKTFAEMGWLPGVPFAALMAAQGALQIATIASQKYAQGGVIPLGEKMGVIKGRSHAQGGHRIYLDGRPVGEVEGDELIAIVNKRDTARIGALSAANSVHGRRFAAGGLITTSAAPPVSFPRASAEVAGYERLVEATSLIQQSIEATNRRIDRLKVVLVTREVTQAQESLKKIEMKNKF